MFRFVVTAGSRERHIPILIEFCSAHFMCECVCLQEPSHSGQWATMRPWLSFHATASSCPTTSSSCLHRCATFKLVSWSSITPALVCPLLLELNLLEAVRAWDAQDDPYARHNGTPSQGSTITMPCTVNLPTSFTHIME